jgi:hypothetical protein
MLPRKARDKRKETVENSTEKGRILISDDEYGHELCLQRGGIRSGHGRARQVGKNAPFSSPFYTIARAIKNDLLFCQARLGTNIGKVEKREAFSCSDQSGEVTTSLSLGGKSKNLTRISRSRLSKISTLTSYDSFIRGNRLASYARFIGVGQLELQFIMVE